MKYVVWKSYNQNSNHKTDILLTEEPVELEQAVNVAYDHASEYGIGTDSNPKERLEETHELRTSYFTLVLFEVTGNYPVKIDWPDAQNVFERKVVEVIQTWIEI